MGGITNQAQTATFAEPALGQVSEITSLAHLQKIIRDVPGVVIDFWSPRCGPCMRFKPKFEMAAANNTNKNIVFCAVQTDQQRETAVFFQV